MIDSPDRGARAHVNYAAMQCRVHPAILTLLQRRSANDINLVSEDGCQRPQGPGYPPVSTDTRVFSRWSVTPATRWRISSVHHFLKHHLLVPT